MRDGIRAFLKKGLALSNILLSLLERFGFGFFASPKTGVYVTKGDNLELFDKFLLSSYYDEDEIRQAYQKSLHKTGMEWSDNFSKQCRYYVLHQVTKVALQNNGHHDVAECGCWKGHSTHLISSILKEHRFSRDFHVFDSFEGGLSEVSDGDMPLRSGWTTKKIDDTKKLFASTLEEVEENLSEFPFVKFHKGWIPERFSDVEDRKFSFVHLDVDLEQPYKDSIEFFFPRLVPNGVMCFDDYGLSQFPGAKKVIDECLMGKDYRFFLAMPTGGAFVIK